MGLLKRRLWERANLNQPKSPNAVSGQQPGTTTRRATGESYDLLRRVRVLLQQQTSRGLRPALETRRSKWTFTSPLCLSETPAASDGSLSGIRYPGITGHPQSGAFILTTPPGTVQPCRLIASHYLPGEVH